MKRFFSILSGLLVLSATLTAWATGDRASGSASPPIISWQAPAFYTSPHSGRTALTDNAAPMPYIALVPCREYDSRNTTKLMEATPRTVTLSGAPCGVPTTAVAVAVNITVFNISGANGNGVFKVDTVSPPLTAWINYPSTETQRGNAGVLSTTGAAAIVVAVYQSGGSVDFTVDVFGYYGSTPANTNNTFTVILPNATTAILGESLGGGIGVEGYSSGFGGKGVYGYNDNAGGTGVYGHNGPGVGVWGDSTSNYGVYGTSSTSLGVIGFSTSSNGVWAQSTNLDGLYAQGGRDGAYITGAHNGVGGVSTGTGVAYYGVWGASASTGSGAAGVYGVDASGPASGHNRTAGVRGSSHSNIGVKGDSDYTGVEGDIYDGSGTWIASGLLGVHFSANYYGVYSAGDYGGVGAKFFVEPHPTDASQVIRYISLEGPESGTYFRGTARTVGGQAVIEVPESFRMVTDEEGLTIQVTPIGAYSQVYVESQDLNQIVIRGSRDVQFHYMVNGVRRAFKNFNPIVPGGEFTPWGPKAVMQASLPEKVKRRLVANGTYNTDGTVNMSTAERLGWAQKWRDDEAKAKAAQQTTAAKAN
jgi:hypothetical protein